jgi:tRNA-specific 2-thiouridylase
VVAGGLVVRKAGKGSVLVLFSGGLDSILAVKLLEEQGVAVEAVHFTCPFYSSDWARKSARQMGIKLHEVRVDKAYFRMVVGPSHGYGSQMNPCIDCKVYMLKRAERLRRNLGLDFLATGEVVGERPFSQSRPNMMFIESEAGLVGRVVRPLSAGLLPPTLAESRGLVRRERMLSLRGRSRKPQMKLARGYGIREYPAPSGGCLLTDPEYARRLRGFLRGRGSITWDESELLRHGRHFSLGSSRIVVGRNEEDNKVLLELARKMGLVRLEVMGYPGPLTVILSRGRPGGKVLEAAAGLTARYSDFSGRGAVRVEVREGDSSRVMEVRAITKRGLERLRA